MINIFLKAYGWIAVTFGGALIWAFGGYIHNDTVIQAGICTLIIGVIFSAILIIMRRL